MRVAEYDPYFHLPDEPSSADIRNRAPQDPRDGADTTQENLREARVRLRHPVPASRRRSGAYSRRRSSSRRPARRAFEDWEGSSENPHEPGVSARPQAGGARRSRREAWPLDMQTAPLPDELCIALCHVCEVPPGGPARRDQADTRTAVILPARSAVLGGAEEPSDWDRTARRRQPPNMLRDLRAQSRPPPTNPPIYFSVSDYWNRGINARRGLTAYKARRFVLGATNQNPRQPRTYYLNTDRTSMAPVLARANLVDSNLRTASSARSRTWTTNWGRTVSDHVSLRRGVSERTLPRASVKSAASVPGWLNTDRYSTTPIPGKSVL